MSRTPVTTQVLQSSTELPKQSTSAFGSFPSVSEHPERRGGLARRRDRLHFPRFDRYVTFVAFHSSFVLEPARVVGDVPFEIRRDDELVVEASQRVEARVRAQASVAGGRLQAVREVSPQPL